MSEEMNEVMSEETVDVELETPSEEIETTEEPQEVDYTSKFLEDFKVKYDGEELGYESMEDLRADAQKGKNYQRMVDKYDTLRNNPLVNYIENRMKASGYNDPEKYALD